MPFRRAICRRTKKLYWSDIFYSFKHVISLLIDFTQNVSDQSSQCLTQIFDSLDSSLHLFNMRYKFWVFSSPRQYLKSRQLLISESVNMFLHQGLDSCECLHLVVKFLLIDHDFTLQWIKHVFFELIDHIWFLSLPFLLLLLFTHILSHYWSFCSFI